MIEVKDMTICFQSMIIENSTISINPNQITLFTGASGCGKTSILNVLGLLDTTNNYAYFYNGKRIDQKAYSEFQRTSISYVFQDYNMLEDLTIEDNFRTMFTIAGKTFDKDEMDDLLHNVSLSNIKKSKKCKNLSGGEKQRCAIALALVKQPKLLLLDEPTANLDRKNANLIVSILNQLKTEGYMIAIATHHADIYNADHIYLINDKKLIEVKNTEINVALKTKDIKRKK